MNLAKLVLGVIPLVVLTNCDENTKPVEVREIRKLTRYDEEGNLQATMPKEWRRVPSTKFRDFNCKFDKDGEVYISIASGTIEDNASRWLKQFGDTRKLDMESLEKLEVFGEEGVIVEAEGTFVGMRGVNIEDARLLGLLVKTKGNLVTVKMIGKRGDVEMQRAAFVKFCQSMRWREEK